MHDIRAIRENPAAFDAALSRRGITGMASRVLAIDDPENDRLSSATTRMSGFLK